MHAADDVHLPQLHRPRPFPPLVIGAGLATRPHLDQPMTHQTPIDRTATRHRHHPVTLEAMTDRARPPPRMLTAQLHDPRLDRRRHLMRTRPRHRRPIDQPRQTLRRIAAQPAVHALAGHPEPSRRPRSPTRRPALRARPDSAAPRARAPPTRSRPPPADDAKRHQRRRLSTARRGPTRNTTTGATVAQLPEPRPRSVTHLPEPTRQASTGPAHHGSRHRREFAPWAPRREGVREGPLTCANADG